MLVLILAQIGPPAPGSQTVTLDDYPELAVRLHHQGAVTVELTVDPRLLATYEAAGDKWHIHAGDYRVVLGDSSDHLTQSVDLALPDQAWSASAAPD